MKEDIQTFFPSQISEANAFSRYIVGSTAPQHIVDRYISIVSSAAPELSRQDVSVLKLIAKYPQAIGSIDSYAALFKPDLELRRRLFIMFAVLEATPEYANKFLPQNRGFMYFFTIVGVSLRVVYRVVFGAILITYLGVKK